MRVNENAPSLKRRVNEKKMTQWIMDKPGQDHGVGRRGESLEERVGVGTS